ncbi:MBL fold metallo-hydrolase [Planococcus sp. CPCC 101016]|nr:MBL fold metallo-hydrolase [Planococcus sp. CPCC 101016]
MSNSKEPFGLERKKGQTPPKRKRRILKKFLVYSLALLTMLAIALLLFLTLHPSFGGNPSEEQQELYRTFANYEDGKFINPSSDMESSTTSSSFEETDSLEGESRPSGELAVSELDWDKINSKGDSLTWFGHSAFLLSLDDKKILIDPMLGPRASPVSFIGPKRYSEDMLDRIDDMPAIDAVFITHDHYDHLDYQSIKKLKSKVGHFFVPYGVANHLVRWGVEKDHITELNWWDETEFQGLTIALTPANHFSGRGPLNRNSTLWGGWIILGEQTRFFTSGDGSYGAHFKEIGDKYGPFDIALIEGGQYDERWPDSHMVPEDSVQATIDLQGNQMMLTHWGAFTLARHSWTEPIERASKAAKEQDVNLIAPRIGETVPLDGSFPAPASSWWK